MDDGVRYELAFGSELNPLDPRGSTFWTDRSGWNHDVFAAYAPDRHQLTISALSIELFDCGGRELAQFSSAPQNVNDARGSGSSKVVGEGNFGTGNLSSVSLSCQLQVQLVDLRCSGRTNRVPFRFEPTTRVYGNGASNV
jgi:hypothetical protein